MKTLKILNCITNEKFIDGLIETCEYTKGENTHDYVIFSKNNNKIVFNNFDYKNKTHRVFLESAFLLSTTHKMDIYLNMPLFPFLYFKYFVVKKRNDKIFYKKDAQRRCNRV